MVILQEPPFKRYQELAIPLCGKSRKLGRRPAWINRKLLLEVGQKNKIYNLWKRGLASQGEYGTTAHICREKRRKAKAQLQMTLATLVSENDYMLFFKYVNS